MPLATVTVISCVFIVLSVLLWWRAMRDCLLYGTSEKHVLATDAVEIAGVLVQSTQYVFSCYYGACSVYLLCFLWCTMRLPTAPVHSNALAGGMIRIYPGTY